MVAHPPCTYLANSGALRLYRDGKKANGPDEKRWASMREGAEFFKRLWGLDIPRIAVENPIMLKHAKDIIGASQSQIIQPWMFGHGETKATALWLKNLPLLVPTQIVEGRQQRIYMMGPSADRQKMRSRTLTGIAAAMASQWGGVA